MEARPPVPQTPSTNASSRCAAPALRADDGGRIEVSLPEAAGAPHGGKIWSLLVAGDWASCRCFEDAAGRPPEHLYGGLRKHIHGADLAVVNLECALAGDAPILKDGVNLRGTAESAKALRSAGFHIATLGNNHAFDYGPEGLAGTLKLCESAGLGTIGAGMDLEAAARPLIVQCGEVTVGLLSFADREEGDAEPDSPGVAPALDIHVLDRVRRLSRQADVTVVIVHGGREYIPVPPPYWYDRVLAIAEAGADVVIGHHPHVPQGLTLLNCANGRTVPVVFSTGNFVFRPAQPVENEIPPRTRDGYMVSARFSGSQLTGLALVPYLIDATAGLSKLPPEPLRRFVTMLEAINEPLASRSAVKDWFDAVADHQWEHGYRERLEVLTRRMCSGDLEAMRHARSHHRSPAHTSIIDRAIERRLYGLTGSAPPEIVNRLKGWYAGTWPCPPSDASA
ncbi:MAG: CapA family protein [Phycisphaerae bacterium]